MFGIQGILSCVYGVIAKVIVESTESSMVYVQTDQKTAVMLIAGVVTAAIGFGFGIFIGVICYWIHTRCDKMYFHDNT